MWALALLTACNGVKSDGPKKIVGTWELFQVELASGEVDGLTAVLNSHQGCVWGRLTMTFEESPPPEGAPPGRIPGHMSATTDVLCPIENGPEMYGCTASARVAAEWDVAGGKWVVADGTAIQSSTRPIDDAAMQTRTSCEARVSPGEYLVVPVRGQKWKWEMRTPDGTVLRLRSPTSERPDFVAALQRLERKGEADGPTPEKDDKAKGGN